MSRQGGQVAEHALARPAPALAGLVAGYVGYRYQGFEPGVHVGMPSRHLTVVVSFDAPLDMEVVDGSSRRPERLAALVGGLSAAPVAIHHDGDQHGVQLELTPAGARALLGVPAAELADQVVPLDALLGPDAHELADRLALAPSPPPRTPAPPPRTPAPPPRTGVAGSANGSRDDAGSPGSVWEARFAVLDEVLGRALARHGGSRVAAGARPEVARAWQRITAAEGAVGVTSLAREVGWSRRHLSEQFRRELGLTPKVATRVLRFERARWLLARPDRPPLAVVAATCGYADQAHMTREWRQLAGATPAAWLADEVFPFVQDDGTLAGGRWTA